MSHDGDPSDPRWFREVLGQYPTGVCVVTAARGDGPDAGFVVGSFTSVSLDPPLVGFFPDRSSTSWPKIRAAGEFCINILGEHQEDVCRRFASKAQDKFGDLPCRRTAHGAPIIDGVVAWLDCALESVTDAGDHFAVLARVRALDIASPALPLLFFQGGYGRFSPLSLAAGTTSDALPSQLRDADLARPAMERLAEELSGRCIATAPLDDERLIVLASAGGTHTSAPATLVGQHLPFGPPTGTAFVAWRDAEAIERWLEHVPEGASRDAHRRQLVAVRERGYSVGLSSTASRAFAAALEQLALRTATPSHDRLRALSRALDYDPVDLTDEAKRGVRVISAPVFDADGAVALVLTAYGFADPRPAGGIDHHLERLRAAAAQATERLAATTPAPL
ncbi:MAG TPA: flavin reductase [Baekduia sp.]|nr:flavin reductase [Baekduia sp.]